MTEQNQNNQQQGNQSPGTGGENDQNKQGVKTPEPKNINFEAFLGGQPPEVKAAYEEHTAKLLNAVKATRDERDAVEQQLHEIKKRLGESPEKAAERLEQLINELSETRKRAGFFEAAASAEVQCKNSQAAYAIAVANKLFDDEGRPRWRDIKKLAPELFGKDIPEGNAGNGTGSGDQGIKQSINEWIRSQAKGQ